MFSPSTRPIGAASLGTAAAFALGTGLLLTLASCGDNGGSAESATTVTIQPTSYVTRVQATTTTEPVNNTADVYYGTGYDAYGPYTPRRMQRSNVHGAGRGHRSSPKDRFHGQGRLPAVIRRPHPPG